MTVIACHVALGFRLPEISSLTRFDVFVFWETVLVFLATIEVVITTERVQQERIQAVRWLERACRFVFPVLLIGASYTVFL